MTALSDHPLLMDDTCINLRRARLRIPYNSICVSTPGLEDFYAVYKKTCDQNEFNKKLVEELQSELIKKDKELEELKQKYAQLEEENKQLTLSNQMDESPEENPNAVMEVNAGENATIEDVLATVQAIKNDNYTSLKVLQEKMAANLKKAEELLTEIPSEQSKKKAEFSYAKHVERLNETLLKEKNMLKEKNQELRNKLKILGGSIGDMQLKLQVQDVTVKRKGRFEIQERHLECPQCHETFNSVEEMTTSMCRYHPRNPVPDVTDEGVCYFWLCCNCSGHKKMSPGCKKGRHRIPSKRAKWEGGEE